MHVLVGYICDCGKEDFVRVELVEEYQPSTENLCGRYTGRFFVDKPSLPAAWQADNKCSAYPHCYRNSWR